MADWDRFATNYDAIFLESPQYVESMQQIVDLVADGEGKRFLDLGCGTGNMSFELVRRFPGADVVCIDPSEGMRELCRQRFADSPNVRVSGGSALEVPFPDGEFDCVMSNLALHHVPPEHLGRCARELARVLKAGGTLIYADMFCDVDGGPEDPERCRDIIDKTTGAALYCLDHGAYEMMLVMLGSIPPQLKSQGEYLTTVDVWVKTLEAAGFVGFEVAGIPPEEFGRKIIRASLES